ncbi:sigma-70 family RNA polymerase sigma factor [bacterium]|nr:sigma-70 family RNA polymerase sigma factor [bacterium]
MTAREFERIYRKLYMPLCMYALRITEDVAIANDTVQNSFAKVWDMIREGYEIDSLEKYLFRTVRNAALQLLRCEQRYVSLPEEEKDVPEEEIDTAERDARLWEAIDSMPPRRREIFLMSKRDGMTYSAIAEELGISIKTVENQLAKATSTLRANTHILTFILPFL